MALTKILESGFSFNCMTYEHDFFKTHNQEKELSKRLLKKHGYISLFEDVHRGWHSIQKDMSYWEDWWINPKYFDSKIMNLKLDKTHYTECVEKLKNNGSSIKCIR